MTDTKDACALLDADHIAVKHLFVAYARLAMAPDAASTTAERHAIAMKICSELTVHAEIEEAVFYPALRKAVPDTRPLLEEATQEHQRVKDLVAQVEGMADAGPGMDDAVAELARQVEHHVKEERDELFPKAKASPKLDLVELGRQLAASKGEREPAV